MDLFTYLGAKNGKFTLPHKSDLFAYLLGKNSKLPIQTASGTTLEITAKKSNVLELTLDKMCSQDGTPTPDNPIEVNVAEGYRNLFSGNYSQFDSTGGTGAAYGYFKLPDDNEIYTLTLIAKNNYTIPSNVYLGFTKNGGNANDGFSWVISQGMTVTAGEIKSYSTKNLRFISIYANNNSTLETIMNNFYVQLEKGSTIHPYVPYGNNYINLNITDGVNSINKQIPLNDNFIGGIGDYKDELVIDKNGNAKLIKKIGKKILNENQAFTRDNEKPNSWRYYTPSNTIPSSINNISLSNYFENKNSSSITNLDSQGLTVINKNQIIFRIDKTIASTTTELKAWLSTHNTDVYYVLETPTTTPLGNIDISLFKGSNIITNSDNCNMTIKYY